MVKRIIPIGWPVKLIDCPPGPFVTLEHPHLLCFKSEYMHDDGVRVMAFNCAGEFFCTGNDCMVQEVDMNCEEEE